MAPSAWRKSARTIGVLAGIAGMAVLGPLQAADLTPEQKLQEIEKAQGETRARAKEQADELDRLAKDINAIQLETVVAAAKLRQIENELLAAEARLTSLERRTKDIQDELKGRYGELAQTLNALAAIARTPPEALLASPGTIADSLRSSSLLAAIIPELEARAAALRGKLDEQAQLQAESTQEKIGFDQARQLALGAREKLQKLLNERKSAQDEQSQLIRATEARSRQLQKEADSVRALIKRLTDEDHAAPPRGAITGQKGRSSTQDAAIAALDPQILATLPAAGQVLRLFGQNTENGLPARGISLETRPTTQVVAPADGKVVFVGPFRGYGQLLIIAHGEEYHSLLAGFSRIDGTVGQQVLRGEPVGVMGGDDDHKPVLYLELRHKGEAVNPFTWLASVGRKVSG